MYNFLKKNDTFERLINRNMKINVLYLWAFACLKSKKNLYLLLLLTCNLFLSQTHSVPNSGNNTWTTCSGTLYDNGGAFGNYGSNNDGYTVITPSTAGNVISISGTISLERGDFITIYEGVGTTGAILYGGDNTVGINKNCSNFTIPLITSTSGSLTVRFQSDGSSQCSGFALTVNCVAPCSNSAVASSPSTLYINNFQFVGVLNNTPANPSTYSTGYQDFTSTPIAQQPQNTAMNITAKTNGTTSGSWKAWVDWNRDGDFNDAGEEIYKMVSYTTPSITFGFIIPATALGVYKLRIGTYSRALDFTACPSYINNGEYEDYLFEAVFDCPAKVVSVNSVNEFDGARCGPGTVIISAKGNASAVNYKWYDSIYGGTYLGSGSTFVTPSISATTTYYVAAVSSGGCETAYRYPVEARIDPNPTVQFVTNDPPICGEDNASALVTAAGDKYQDVIFETFDTGLGVFNNVVDPTGNSFTYSGNNISDWLNKPSNYIPTVPPYQGTAPAFSSGYFGGNYAMINSDIARTTNILNHLVSNNLDVSGFLNLKIEFDMYHFSIAANDTEGYVNVDYSLNGGTTWVNLTHFFADAGNPFNWQKYSYNIPGGPFTTNQFKLRFSHFSKAQSSPNIFYEAITSVDNVRLSGFKTITTPFAWNSPTVSLYDTDCTTPLLGTDLRTTVCVKPTATELEDVNWTINANATFSNGCPASGSFVVDNDTKTWRQPGITDWNQGAQWRPSSVPTINKCVIVRTPVELPTNTNGSHGLARSVIVKSGGKLTINPKSSLTIQNYLKNEAAASDVLVESDANLLQINNSSVNIGNITVKRDANLKRLDYNYWGTPVTGQNVRNFSTNTLTNRFYVYREKDDFFDGVFSYSSYSGFTIADAFPLQSAATYTFELGKGYAIRAPNDFTNTVTNFSGAFLGVPNNGVVNIPIVCSSCSVLPPAKGNNLISNPYPSNIDFEQVYTLNSGLIYNTYFVWTNTNYNPKMQGENYPGTGIINNYALYNAIGGLTAPYGFTGLGTNTPVTPASPPNRYIKVGQGFIVKAKGNGTLTLNNSMRSTDNTAIFFNRMGSNEQLIDRFWLSLKTPLDFVSPILIGYKKGASNRYEMDYDAEHVVIGSDSFYSLLDDKKLAIQGRYPFQIEDSIPLGTNYYESGIHTISLDRAEGVFANGQNIYLKDNYTGVVTNLSQSPYRFTADAGEVKNRFEILYTNRTLGSSQVNQKEPFVIYKEDNAFVINANEVITLVKLFDVTGKLVNEQKVGYKSTKIFFTEDLKGVFLLEIITPTKRYTHKVIN